MEKAKKEAVQIGLISLVILALQFILPEPMEYKGPAVDVIPLANYFVVACGISGILYSLYLFSKR